MSTPTERVRNVSRLATAPAPLDVRKARGPAKRDPKCFIVAPGVRKGRGNGLCAKVKGRGQDVIVRKDFGERPASEPKRRVKRLPTRGGGILIDTVIVIISSS